MTEPQIVTPVQVKFELDLIRQRIAAGTMSDLHIAEGGLGVLYVLRLISSDEWQSLLADIRLKKAAYTAAREEFCNAQ